MDVQIACPCPPKADGEPRHAHDTVTLRDKLGFLAATSIRNTITFAKAQDAGLGEGEIMAMLTEGYILHGIESWTLVDLDDKNRPFPVPATKAEIRARLLVDPLLAEPIGEAADDLYGPTILIPLVQRALSSSEPSQTDESTSVPPSDPKTPTGSSSRPKRSKRSSTSTTPMVGIETTTGWHGGVSSSSPSSATAS